MTSYKTVIRLREFPNTVGLKKAVIYFITKYLEDKKYNRLVPEGVYVRSSYLEKVSGNYERLFLDEIIELAERLEIWDPENGCFCNYGLEIPKEVEKHLFTNTKDGGRNDLLQGNELEKLMEYYLE